MQSQSPQGSFSFMTPRSPLILILIHFFPRFLFPYTHLLHQHFLPSNSCSNFDTKCHVPILWLSLNTQENANGNKLERKFLIYYVQSSKRLQLSKTWNKTKTRSWDKLRPLPKQLKRKRECSTFLEQYKWISEIRNEKK